MSPRFGRCSDSSVQPITEVAKTGDDEFLGVQLPIDDGCVDRHIGMMLLDERDPFGSRHNANHADDRRARALGMDHLIGSLEPGKRADIIAVSTAATRQTPSYDPVSLLVYVTRGDDVRTTIVNGKVLMQIARRSSQTRIGSPRASGTLSPGER